MFYLENEKVPFINEDIELNKIKDESYCQVGDLVIADASEDYADIGKTMEIMSLNNEKTLAGLHTFLARPNKYDMALGYTGYLLQSWKIRKQIMRIAQGTKVLSLSTKRLADVTLHLPTKPEQQKIATFLSAVDSSIEQLGKKEQLLRDYKKGVMQKIFSQEIRFRRDDGGVFEDWVEKRLGEACKKIASGKSKKVENGEYNLYGSTGIIGQTNEYSHSGIFILVARVGANAGLTNIVKGMIGVSDNTLVIEPNDDMEVTFILRLLHHYNLNKLIFGSGQPLITGGQLKKLKLKFPPLPEQTKIANFLSSLDKQIEQVSKQLAETKTFKKGLLQQMFV